VPQPSALHGDLRCAAGAADCNPCAQNVPAQLSGGGWSAGKENLSLLTECETGDLYTVHVGSSDSSHLRGPRPKPKFVRNPPRTFWRVSRVVISSQGALLEPVGVFTRSSTLERCFGRAAGSAFVQDNHQIELYCHQRKHLVFSLPVWNFWQHLADLPPPQDVPAALGLEPQPVR
jgi:hypothetical protein